MTATSASNGSSGHVVAARLVARTRRLDRDVDLLRWAGRDGVLFARGRDGFAGRGVALEVDVDAAVTALAAIRTDDEVGLPGCGPVAFGALPFNPGNPRHERLIVPRVTIGKTGDGTRWLTTIADMDDDGSAARSETLIDESAALAGDTDAADVPQPTAFDVRATRPPREWCAAVTEATARIRAGELDKVVLAREVLVSGDQPIDATAVLTRLRATYPDCFVFSVDGFVGASPELLVSRHGDVVRAQPMAGTAPRRGDANADARLAANLLASTTYRHEHQVTIDVVHDTLLPFCSYVDYEAEPSVVALANVQHLATSVEGRLSHPPASVLELRDTLHPTPAVCGRPREAARALLAELEGFDRGRYAGSVGWVDRHGNGTWAISIRCAQLDGAIARTWGGNGIVATSDPDVELDETKAKFQAMLSAIVRP